jgi:hypothetical protein
MTREKRCALANPHGDRLAETTICGPQPLARCPVQAQFDAVEQAHQKVGE